MFENNLIVKSRNKVTLLGENKKCYITKRYIKKWNGKVNPLIEMSDNLLENEWLPISADTFGANSSLALRW
jgi:hypothetical protein